MYKISSVGYLCEMESNTQITRVPNRHTIHAKIVKFIVGFDCFLEECTVISAILKMFIGTVKKMKTVVNQLNL